MSVFRGSGVALVTPFHEDKSVNFEMLEYLVERQITNETDAIVVCGTTGEPATMSEEERLAVIKAVVAKTNHRIPVIAGVGCNATERTISFMEKVNDLGIGPGGLGGRVTAIGLNIETYPTHIAGLPVAVNICCHVNRHIKRIL